ncbi:MAG: hypothetical protein U5L45_22550 [Saprospiraceae bacterium]|nr:hypothetical protein [Saprospiraceae bacterium]
MKIYFKIFLFCILIQPSFCLENKIYSISVCTTSSKESANICKENILKTSNLEAFVQENLNKSYSVYLGKFTTYDEAKKVLNNSSNFIKKQKPFIKEIENNIKIKEIERKIKEVDEEIRILDEKIINVNEKEKALAEVQRMESEKVLADELRKKTELEAQKIKEENKKALAEFQKNKEEKEKSFSRSSKNGK